jgi:hypothetical protein
MSGAIRNGWNRPLEIEVADRHQCLSYMRTCAVSDSSLERSAYPGPVCDRTSALALIMS